MEINHINILRMKLESVILFTCLLSIFIVFPAQSSLTSGSINWWCNQTPYPEPCKYHMRHSSSQNIPSSITRNEFLTMSENIAMEESLAALRYTKSLGPKCLNKVEKSAWTECLQFYQLTVQQLNQTLDKTLKPTPSDTQTWLSAALTNLRTCQTDFIDLNVTRNIYPLIISNNVTQLISNCLAINFDFTNEKNSTKLKEFPFWFPSDDRRRLFNSPPRNADCVVAQDGSGNFKSITQALEASFKRKNDGKRFVIYVKKGVYSEDVEVTDKMKNIMLVGDGLDNTIITGRKSTSEGLSLFASATAKVMGPEFIARDMTFENSAGVDKGPAVAFASASDRSVFYRCSFKGYQDTLFVHSQRQFYKKCQIWGTVDFIFGNAAVVFQNCHIYARKPQPGGGLVITAQGRSTPHENTGISIQKSRIVATPELVPLLKIYKAYLGRPWEDYSRTVFLQSFLDALVHPAGWLQWPGHRLDTIYYGEYENSGPGSSTNGRVHWPGYHIIRDTTTANRFTVASMITGQTWLPATRVPFISGLTE